MILNIRGTNGSGKTTVTRSFFPDKENMSLPVVLAEQEIHSPTKKDPDRMVTKAVVGTLCPHDVMVIGSYRNNCGGCDEFSWKGAHDALCEAVLKAAREHEHVIFEGITVSSVFTRYVDLAERCYREAGQLTHWLLLNPPLETCLKRITARSGREADERMRKNVGTKHGVVAHFPEKLAERERSRLPHPSWSVETDTSVAIRNAHDLMGVPL